MRSAGSRNFAAAVETAPDRQAVRDSVPVPAHIGDTALPGAATIPQRFILADQILRSSAYHPTEQPLSRAVTRLLVAAAFDRPISEPDLLSPTTPGRRGPEAAAAPALPWVTVCVGVAIDGHEIHAPGCRMPFYTNWPNRTDGLSPECEALTRRVAGLPPKDPA